MSLCKASTKKTHLIVLFFFSVGFGALLSTLLTVYFIYKWKTQLEARFKHKVLPRLCGVIIVLLSIVRVFRLIETILWFYAPRWITGILYHINSFVFVGGLIATLYSLLIEQLKKGFQNTIYSIPPEKVAVLYGLTGLLYTLLILLFILNDIHSIRFSLAGKLLIAMLAIIILIISISLLVKLNMEFSLRLRQLVACQTADNTPTVATGGRRKSQYDTDEDRHETNHDDDYITVDKSAVHIGHTRDIGTMSVTEIASEVTLSAITRARVSSFDQNYQGLLLTAAKSMVTAVWISVSFVLLFFSSIFIALGSCVSWMNVIGYGLASIAFGIIGITLILGLPNAEDEYHEYCSLCDSMVQSVVAWQTTRKVFEIKQIIEEKNLNQNMKNRHHSMDKIDEEQDGDDVDLNDRDDFCE